MTQAQPPRPAMSKSSQITGLSKLSKSEKCVTFSGNIRASYLNFSLETGSDDEGWSSGQENEEEELRAETTRVQQHPNIIDLTNRKLETFDPAQVQYPERIKYLYLSQNILQELPENIFLVLFKF